MATWEYMVTELHVGSMGGDEQLKEIQRLLNELGRQGWELVTFHRLPYWAYLKRQKS